MTAYSPYRLDRERPAQRAGTSFPCDLRVQGVTKRYGDFSLRDVALDVPRGSVVGLVGRNGAGKTTLMKVILGAALPDAGRIELFGHDVASLGNQELIRLRERVAYVNATVSYPSGMRVWEVSRMYELAYPRFDRSAYDRLCAVMELDVPRHKVSDLSRGMGMKLQLACALATGADLLVLDEPTAGLDPIVREELLDVLRSWMEDEARSMFVSSHITSDLEHLADYLVMIEQGAVALACECDTIRDVMGVANLRSHELQQVLDDGFLGDGQARVLRRDLSCLLLVPQRAAFMRAYPDFACDRATIDDVMAFIVKGEVR